MSPNPTPTRMPAVFVGHGSPMNTLEHNRWTEAWHELGRSLPRPRAVLAISAHWYIGTTAATAMARPRTIHDFAGFPQALFDVEYPAPGAPDLVPRIAEVVAPVHVLPDHDAWGLDHGTWSVLAHVYPDADVPVVQLSLDAGRTAEEHVAQGAALAPLRDEGVLVLASGNVVHNLGLLDWGAPGAATDWNVEFDAAARGFLADDPAGVHRLTEHPAYRLAAPSPDHLIPLYHVAGLAAAAGTTGRVFVDGGAYGSLSMTSFVVD